MHDALASALRTLDAPKDTVAAAVESWKLEYLEEVTFLDET